MLLSEYTRYDITYAVNQLARAMNKPFKLHMTAAKHLLRYLDRGMGLLITYKTGCFEMMGIEMRAGATTLTTTSQPPATCSCWLEGH